MIDNKYALKKFIGMGGSSKVYLAQDEMGQRVALKVIRKDKKYSKAYATTMVKREHDMLRKLADHPNVICSLGINYDGLYTSNSQTEPVIYSIIELAENGSLSS